MRVLLHRLIGGLRRLFHATQTEQDLDEEVRAYLDTAVEHTMSAGMTREAVVRAARLEMGSPEAVKDWARDVGWESSIETFWRDLRFAARLMRRSPGFATTAVLTLALGIGANVAIFQLINAVRLQRLPVRNPGELAEVRIVGGNHGFGVNPGRYGQLTRPVWQQLRTDQQAFSGAFAWAEREVRVGELSELRPVNGIAVSGEFFSVLGVAPWRGRLIEPADEASACPPARAVVSYAYWQREMGGRELDRARRLRVNGELAEVIGVAPPGFFGLAVGESFDIALPLCQENAWRREVLDLIVMGRLRRGWTIARASGHLQALSPGIFDATAPTGYSARRIEAFKAFRMAAYPASAGVSWLRTQYDASLRLLLGITGLVLLMACANLANLMLARAVARDREVAVRLALGASSTRLLRQFLVEGALLAALGAVLGTGCAQVVSRVLIWALSTGESSPTLSLTTDWRMLLFTAAVAVATCVTFGVAPALRATRTAPAAAMNTGGRGMTAGRERFSIQRLMVVTQIAVSLVLLVGALLFVGSFHKLMTFNPGMRQSGITVAHLGLVRSGVAPERLIDLQRELLAEVQSIPGIRHAGTTTNVPLFGSSWGHGVRAGTHEGGARFTWVSPGYFDTMNIPIVQGRDFTLRDTPSSPRVAVVNQAFVRALVDGGKAIGQTLRTNPEPRYPSAIYEIVGVIPDTQYDALRGGTPPMVFAPDSQFPAQGPWATMMIHSSVAPATAVANIKGRLSRTHPEIILEFVDFQARIRDGLVRERLLAMLAGSFGSLAAVLTMVGLYGMIAFVVAQRRQEIGIRLALGAQWQQIVGMVMREAGWLLLIGLVVGTGLSLLAGRGVASLLFGLTPHDPRTLLAACLPLGIIAAAATFVPAHGASRLDPLTSLRQD